MPSVRVVSILIVQQLFGFGIGGKLNGEVLMKFPESALALSSNFGCSNRLFIHDCVDESYKAPNASLFFAR